LLRDSIQWWKISTGEAYTFLKPNGRFDVGIRRSIKCTDRLVFGGSLWLRWRVYQLGEARKED